MTRRILSILFVAGLVLAIWLGSAGTVGADPPPNYAFIPNSGEASVSRVELVSMTEVARYYTAPRFGDEVDLVGNPTPGTQNTVDPGDWRTSRIAMDSNSNAWVINTGADGTNLQGSIVRVQADTTGMASTHEYTSQSPKAPDPLPFGTDEAVQVFPVGAPGDMPRAIAIDADDHIWVGFYSGAQLMKYEYDDAAGTLTAVAGPFFPDLSPDNNVIRYYDMVFAPDGTLFISSRGSNPTRTPRQEGIWAFDPESATFVRETTWNPYALLIAGDGTVYATAYSNLLWIRDKDTGMWSSVTITGSSQNRGMEFDGLGRIWIASTVGTTGGTTVYSYDIAAGTPGPTYALTSGTTPVGMGRDAAGVMWTVCRSDAMAQGWLEGFDPTTQAKVGAVEVGFKPYAYRDFVAPLATYQVCGYKYLAGTTTGLAGWQIILEKLNRELEPPDYELFAATTTAGDGSYCFSELPAGEYRIRETLEPGWRQVQPADPNYHEITLPGDASHPGDGPFHNFQNREDIMPPTAGWQTSPLHMTLWTALFGGLAGAGLLLLRRRRAQG